jgi:hypothetical protein
MEVEVGTGGQEVGDRSLEDVISVEMVQEVVVEAITAGTVVVVVDMVEVDMEVEAALGIRANVVASQVDA